MAISRRRFRLAPAPISASPDTGNQKAYTGPLRNRLAGVVTRGVVVIDNVLVIAPLFRFGIGLGPNWQFSPAGSPEHWPREI